MADANAIAGQLIQYYEECARKINGGLIAPYPDAKGVATIGWGNTVWQNGTKVTLSDGPISQAEADALFAFWLNVFSKDVQAYVPGASAYELAAFISLSYNIGLTAFSHSTALRQYLLANKTAAGDAIELWDRAGGQVLLGLQRRRRAEHLVFNNVSVANAVARAELDFP